MGSEHCWVLRSWSLSESDYSSWGHSQWVLISHHVWELDLDTKFKQSRNEDGRWGWGVNLTSLLLWIVSKEKWKNRWPAMMWTFKNFLVFLWVEYSNWSLYPIEFKAWSWGVCVEYYANMSTLQFPSTIWSRALGPVSSSEGECQNPFDEDLPVRGTTFSNIVHR
jgi:hypothetical protein